jgi:CRISPR-associated protein Csb2
VFEDTPFDPAMMIFCQTEGRRFGLESCGLIAEAIRKELMSRFGAESPEWLSGHEPNGEVSKLDRPAFVPLAFVDHEYADGHVLGVAIVVPQGFPHTDAIMELILRDINVEDVPEFRCRVVNPHFRDSVGELVLQLEERPDHPGRRPFNLMTRTWIGPSRIWRTATPMMLPQFPRRHVSVEDVIIRACVDGGYPEPVSVREQFAPLISGTPHAKRCHVKARTGRPPRPLIHTEIVFPVPVLGPVLLGAGRYAGYGFCRPIHVEETA